MYQAPPRLGHSGLGTLPASLMRIGILRGALLGWGSAQLYGVSVLTVAGLLSHMRLADLGLVVLVGCVPVCLIGGMPGLLLGALFGGINAHKIRGLPPTAGVEEARGWGIVVAVCGCLCAHMLGLAFLATLAQDLAALAQILIPYAIILGLPTVLATVVSAHHAAALFRRRRAGTAV